MICAIHQPQFIPWIGYFDKLLTADVFVFLDDVQFKKNEFQNRNRMLVNGAPHWITVPVHYKFGDTIHTVTLHDALNWRDKMARTLEVNYARAPYFSTFMPAFDELIRREWSNLANLNIACINWLLEVFEVETVQILRSSDLTGLSTHPTGRLIDICQHVGADTYLSGAGGRQYLDQQRFPANTIELTFQTFTHPVYPQITKGDFVPYLSIMDALFNCGGGQQGRRRIGLLVPS